MLSYFHCSYEQTKMFVYSPCEFSYTTEREGTVKVSSVNITYNCHSAQTDNILRCKNLLLQYQMMFMQLPDVPRICFRIKTTMWSLSFLDMFRLHLYFRVSWSINATLDTSKHNPKTVCVGLMKRNCSIMIDFRITFKIKVKWKYQILSMWQ